MRRQLLFVNAVLLLVSYLILTNPEQVNACGPGRAGARRRMPRKYPPLVQRQYIPNVDENTLGASGRPEGAIKRKDKRFMRDLIKNSNPDIEFRDDERTGADRMMTQRLKEKLSTLAISVMNQWPNVKLRVIEGWDEDNRHSLNSLHYEGRAVDITTSDRDKSKYGMLARLAVEAGFDWVHYESRSHVHCSVKSEKADTIRNNGCFDAKSLIQTPDGPMQMSQLQINDQVLTMNSRGQLQFSPILMWLDKDESGQELFVELKTKSNLTIRLTSSHLIYVADDVPLDLTQQKQQPEQPPLMSPTQTKPVKQNTGNEDNNQNNYHFYYQTLDSLGQTYAAKNTVDESVRAGTISVPKLTNNSNRKPYNFVPPSVIASTMDEVTFTTYARNVIVGQYLLVNSPTPPLEEHSGVLQNYPDATAKSVSQDLNAFAFPSENNNEEGFNRFRYDVDRTENQPREDVDRTQSRLVFNLDRQSHIERLPKDGLNGNLVPGDDGETTPTTIRFDQIVSVNYVTRKGIYAPLTREGNIVVNSVVASCYAVISDHELAHMSFAPVRWLSYLSEFLSSLNPHSHRIDNEASRSLPSSTQQSDTLTKHIIGERQDDILTGASQSTDSRLGNPVDTNATATTRVIHWYPSMLYRIARFILPTRYLY